MSEREERKILIVSNDGKGIGEAVERIGFTLAGIVPHNNWNQHLGEMSECFMVVLDEVDQFISGNLRLTDEEERILYGGPVVLVLVRDDDHRLDELFQQHGKWIIHHKSKPLNPCLQSIYLHASNEHPKLVTFP